MVENKVLNLENPFDTSLVALLYNCNINDVTGMMLNNFIHLKAMNMDMQEILKGKHIIEDFELSGINEMSRRNLRVRGGHAKMTNYTTMCVQDLAEFKKDMTAEIDKNILDAVKMRFQERFIPPLMASPGLVIEYAKAAGYSISAYKALAITYVMITGWRFILTRDHIDYLKRLYITVCTQLLNSPGAVDRNIPKPMSLIYIIMRQCPVCRYPDLRKLILMMPISTSMTKINDISNVIFDGVCSLLPNNIL